MGTCWTLRKAKKRISDEIQMLKNLKHPKIIAFINAWTNKEQEKAHDKSSPPLLSSKLHPKLRRTAGTGLLHYRAGHGRFPPAVHKAHQCAAEAQGDPQLVQADLGRWLGR